MHLHNQETKTSQISHYNKQAVGALPRIIDHQILFPIFNKLLELKVELPKSSHLATFTMAFFTSFYHIYTILRKKN